MKGSKYMLEKGVYISITIRPGCYHVCIRLHLPAFHLSVAYFTIRVFIPLLVCLNAANSFRPHHFTLSSKNLELSKMQFKNNEKYPFSSRFFPVSLSAAMQVAFEMANFWSVTGDCLLYLDLTRYKSPGNTQCLKLDWQSLLTREGKVCVRCFLKRVWYCLGAYQYFTLPSSK